LKNRSVKKKTRLKGAASLWTGVVVISLTSVQARGDATKPDMVARELDANGKYRLADLDVQDLQKMLNALNADCLPGGIVSCSWTVLSLTHQATDTASNSGSAPAIVVEPPNRAQSNKRFSSDVPPGFEQFADRQSEDISLYYDGVSLLTARIVVESDSYLFSDPLRVANELTKLKIADRTTLEYFLSEPFPVSDAGICVVDTRPQNCQTQQPLEIALLPKLDENRVDILINLDSNGQDRLADTFLPASSSGLSARAGVRATYASVGAQAGTVDGNVDASISYGNGGVFAKNSFSGRGNENRLNELFFSHQFEQHQLKIGTVAFQQSEFLLNRELVGVDWSTSFNRFTNIRELYSTPIYVTLSSPSVVQLLVNKNLRSSESLPPGNHRLNTTNLPNGTYEVEVRIQDASNGIQTQRQFFSKRLSLPPPDKVIYSLSAGRPRLLDDKPFGTTGDALFAGSISKRLSPTLGLDVEIAAFANEQTAQARLSRIGTNYELSLGALVGTESMLGSSFRAAYTAADFRLYFQGTRFSSNHDLQANEDIAQFVRDDFYSRAIGGSFKLGEYRFGLLAENIVEDSVEGVEERERFSARLRRRLPIGSPGSSMSAAYLDTDTKSELQLQIDLVLDGPESKHKTTLEFVKPEGSAIQPALGYQYTYNPTDGFTPFGTADASLAFLSRVSEKDSFAGGDLRLTHQFYDLGLGIDLFDDPISNDIEARTIASIGTQLAVSKDKVAVGRNTGQTAGVIIDVDGQPEGSTFDVKVNGSQRGVGRVGSKFFLPLQPFRQHRIDLLPHSIVLGNFESSSRSVTLYPGNVAVLQVDVQGRYLLITRFADSEGEIISDKVIRYQGQPYYIKGDGVVQIEVVSGDNLDIDLGEDELCSVDIPNPNGKEIVIESVPLVCL